MIKKLIYLVCFLGVAALAGVAQAETLSPDDASIKDNLCLWLRRPEVNYDADSGVWTDLSGRGHDAVAVGEIEAWGVTYVGPTLAFGSNPTVFDHPFGIVKFTGEIDDLMRAANLNEGSGLTELTILAVYKDYNYDESNRSITRPLGFGSISGEGENMGDNFNLANDVSIRKDNGSIGGATATHPEDTFFIRAARMDSSRIDQWFNADGTLEHVHTASGSSYTTSTDNFYLGDLRAGNSTTIGGSFSRTDIEIAEVIVYNRVLTEAQIEGLSEWLQTHVGISAGEGYPFAFGPDPRDGVMLLDTWANLSWRAGDFAVSHDVYIGDNFDDVNDGAEGTFQGNQNTTLVTVGFPGFAYPDGLVPGSTYYWRIDEVNEADPNSPWKGPVWSFWIQPSKAYDPVPPDNAELVATDASLSWTAGFGAKLHTVYFDESFDDVNNAAEGLPQGTATYDPGPLELAKTYYWRVDEFDIIDTYKGTVWSFTTEGAVANPDPSNGAVDVKQTQILTWSPSVFAASHEVYFGSDKDAVKNADISSPEYKGTRSLGSESYDPGMLEWDSTYYWRIDEVNNTNPDSPWTGILWNFTTANFLVVDDFESYNDLDPADPESNRIFNAWIDGYDDPANGSLVGYDTPPFAEQTIVHGGNQSMPLYYDNSVGYSEATLTLTYPRDWTENGVNTLRIWFRGNSDNAAETLYVALNGNAIVTNDNPDAAQVTTWTEWTIDLQAFADQGVNLANVNTISLGLGNRNNPLAGGSGTMYFDDIRLYPPPPEPTP
ncbi:MAG: hypothetical protein E3J30_07860 [Anaerolineales bacterium]|nr:MAG: hypothetical protein E3J30_07860 [Anaerolineales bacterium]